MFGIGLPELVIILIVALLVVGPKKLPEVARSVGRALGEFRRMADDVKETLTQEMDREDEQKEPAADESAADQSAMEQAAADPAGATASTPADPAPSEAAREAHATTEVQQAQADDPAEQGGPAEQGSPKEEPADPYRNQKGA